MATDFMNIFGFNKITITGNATSKWGSARLRVALVLDTTGSMDDDGKIDALKTATKSLIITQLKSAVSVDGDVYVSIIPFSKDVNVDSTNSIATWIDWSDWEAPPSGLATAYTDTTGPGDSCPYSSPHRVQVNTGGDPTSTLRQNCASSSDKFFLLTSANQIITTFQKTGTQLSKLRIAQ